MAGGIKGIEIAISADTSGVTKGLKEVTTESMKTSKNLKTVDSLLKLDPHNTELVAEKQKLLASNIEQTKDKLNKLKSAQDDVKKAFERGDISEEQYIAFQGEIVKTENRLKDLEGQTKDTGKAMDDAGDKAGGFGEKLKKGLSGAAEAAGIAVAAVGTAVVAGTKALADFSVEGAAYADTVLTDATVTGIATDKLQEYQYAAELIDVSTETLTKSMTKNISSMKSAAKGTGEAAEAYQKLGIDVLDADGNFRDSQEVYWELIDALGQVENETERDTLAMSLLGKSAQELNPLIEAGSERMDELGQQARDAGAVLSDDTLNAFGEFDDQLQYLKVNSNAAKRALGTALLPMLTKLGTSGNKMITKFTNSLLDANGDLGKMADAVGELIPDLIENIVSALPQILSAAQRIVSSLANGIIAQLPTIIEVGLRMISDLALGIAQALPDLIPTIVDIVLEIVDTLLDNIDLLVDAAIALIEGLAEGLINALPILLEKAPIIIEKLVNAVIDNLPKLVLLGIEIIVKLVEGIVENFPKIVEAAVNLVKTLIEGIKSYFDKMEELGGDVIEKFKSGVIRIAAAAFEWGADLVNGLIDGIKSKIEAVETAASLVAETIKNYLHFSVPDVGPLTDYESWMPDFMKGLAAGIEKNKSLVTDAVRGLANDMVLSPTANISGVGALGGGGISQIITINVSANVSNDMDLRHLAESLGQELQTITAQNAAMQGAY